MSKLNAVLDALAGAAARVGARGPAAELRRFLGGVGWILRTGAPWRDLPGEFGRWNSVFRRFRRWVSSGRWDALLADIRRGLDPGAVLLIDSTMIKVHPDAAGAPASTADAEALGRSRGGFTTKLHALVSSDGRWGACVLTQGQRGDITQALPLLATVHTPRVLVGDRAYDANALLDWLSARVVVAVIPSKKNRRKPRSLDRATYAERNVIERFFGRLKRYRRVGTRYDKTVGSFGAFVGLAATVVERTAW